MFGILDLGSLCGDSESWPTVVDTGRGAGGGCFRLGTPFMYCSGVSLHVNALLASLGVVGVSVEGNTPDPLGLK